MFPAVTDVLADLSSVPESIPDDYMSRIERFVLLYSRTSTALTLTFAQEQLLLHSFFLQVHVVSSNRLVGAGSLDISFGVSSSSSFCHPRPSGDGSSSKESRLFLQMYVW